MNPTKQENNGLAGYFPCYKILQARRLGGFCYVYSNCHKGYPVTFIRPGMAGTVIYGYLLADEKRERWIVDEEAAAVVRRIFTMTMDGHGPHQIAQRLTADKVEILAVQRNAGTSCTETICAARSTTSKSKLTIRSRRRKRPRVRLKKRLCAPEDMAKGVLIPAIYIKQSHKELFPQLLYQQQNCAKSVFKDSLTY